MAFDWRLVIAVLIGGAIGSLCRYAATVAIMSRVTVGFPWATLAINIAGSVLIGAVFQMTLTRAFGITPLVRTFLMTGILGGFTTFSAFSLELTGLMMEGAPLLALLYALSSVCLGVLGAFGGMIAVRSMQP